MRKLIFLTALLLCPWGELAAQEVQQAIHGDLDVIDARLAANLDLFTDVPGFREARLFRNLDGDYVLEVVQRVDGRTLKTRRPLNADQVTALRHDVAAAFELADLPTMGDNRGRTGFLVWTFALSYGFYSWAVPVTLDLTGSTSQAVALGIGSAGFIVPFRITGRTPVSRARQSLSLHGGRMGIAHGLVLSELLLGDGNGWRSATGMALAGSLAGLVAGFRGAERTGWSAGTCDWIGSGGAFGTAMGAGSAYLLDLWKQDRRRPGPALMLAGAGAGYWAAHRMAMAQPYTRGDAAVAGLTVVLGAYVPTVVLMVADVESGKAFTAAAMAGGVAGVVGGDRLVRGRDFGLSQSRLLALGTAAGFLLAGAGATIVDAGERATNGAMAIGAVTGYTAMFRSLEPQAHGGDEDEDGGWTWGLDPRGRRLVAAWSFR